MFSLGFFSHIHLINYHIFPLQVSQNKSSVAKFLALLTYLYNSGIFYLCLLNIPTISSPVVTWYLSFYFILMDDYSIFSEFSIYFLTTFWNRKHGKKMDKEIVWSLCTCLEYEWYKFHLLHQHDPLSIVALGIVIPEYLGCDSRGTEHSYGELGKI